jgi:MOSC domain-containing protein YiiM
MSLQQSVANPEHLTPEELEAGLPTILTAPRDEGVLELIVRRPAVEEREVVEEAALDLEEGLVGDNWRARGRSKGRRPPNPKAQITVTSSRATALVARTPGRWPLAGDQLYVDLDLSDENLPPGTRLRIGSAVIEVTDEPHTGCEKYRARFGMDALAFASTTEGRALNLRGINARVVEPGTVRTGDAVRKL